MSQLEQPGQPPAGAEQRAYRRYSVRLPAVLQGPGDGSLVNCEIRDFCLGGMYLAFDRRASEATRPTVGETIEIGTSIPDAAGRRNLRFLARVVRSAGDSAGVALLDVDLSAIRALQGFAAVQARRASPPSAGASPGRPDPARTAAIIDEYRRIVGDSVYPILHAFLDEADRRLYDLAARAPDMSSENLYLGTQGALKGSARDIKARMGEAILERLAEGPARDAEATPDESGSLTLTLMEHDDLENWLAVSDLVNHVEQAHQSLLTDLERRLTHLHQVPVNDGNNPLGPALFAHAFREAIAPLNLEHSMKMLCFSTFKETLGRDIADVYRKVNGLLIENAILPDLKPTIVRTDDKTTGAARGAGAAAPDAPAQEAVKPPPTTRPPAPSGPGRADHTAPVTPLPTSGAPASATAPHDLYQVVNELRKMQQQLVNAAVRSTPEENAPQGSAATFDTTEILAALNQLQSQNLTAGAPAAKDLHAAVMAALATDHPAADKRIGAREQGVMDVAGNLFDSLLQDMMVAKSVRGWLQRLKIPMIKLAIQDESLFLDKSHTARQVMNRIAQLELYGEDQGHSSVQRTVDNILNRITGQVDADPAVFAKALKELNRLIKIQDEAYAENVRDVIARCEQEQPRGDTRPLEPEGTPSEEQRQWRKRAQRLRAGHWVLFTAETGQPQRLKLAWISENRDRYAFVNLRGLEAASLSVAELADRLRDGSAVVLDNADEPAVDRAQHAMLQKLHHQLLHESTHDQLTGLINRREFERRIDASLAGGCDAERQQCLCYLDIDQLSVINTTCGYGAGDSLLVEVSGLLRRIMGNRAVTARLGADDFGILLPRRSQSEALGLVHELLEAVRGYRFEWQDKRFTVSLGVGLVQAGERGMTAADLLQAAESCCHSAKVRGTNQVHVYHADDSDMLERQKIMHWVSRIDKALDEGSLTLRCQPIASLQGPEGQRSHHYEILLGVTDEAGRPISPAEFIAAAERYNRMQSVDRWVIRSVFGWMADHRDRLAGIGGFAINLSGRSLSDETLVDFIRDEAEKSAVAMDKVCFEVTETAGINNLSDATEFILRIKETGCRFSLDDFGSGLSSYAYLKSLPVDFLKIDGAFVKDMHRNPSDFAVVKSICEIGHFMGKQVIAEFVESREIVQRLREIGVDYAQGHIIGVPRPLQALADPADAGRGNGARSVASAAPATGA